MKEAQENVAKFPELEPQDFERVCEFAYTGSIFTKPNPELFDKQRVNITEDFFLLSRRLAWESGIILEKRNC
jgi:hypothetical protein